MLNDPQTEMLRKMAAKPLSVIELAPEITSRKIDIKQAPGVKLAQRLTKLGYVRDYGNQHGRRVPVNLRIWGITDSGRAVIEQQSLVENRTNVGQSQLALVLGSKPPLELPAKKPMTTYQVAEIAKQRKKKAVQLLPPDSPDTSKLSGDKLSGDSNDLNL